jgi:hypothetical protein
MRKGERGLRGEFQRGAGNLYPGAAWSSIPSPAHLSTSQMFIGVNGVRPTNREHDDGGAAHSG